MKPYEHIRKGTGYCCELCDGPYPKYVKKQKKRLKAKNKRIVEKDIQEQLEQDEEQRR